MVLHASAILSRVRACHVCPPATYAPHHACLPPCIPPEMHASPAMHAPPHHARLWSMITDYKSMYLSPSRPGKYQTAILIWLGKTLWMICKVVTVAYAGSGDLCKDLMSISQQLVWLQLICIYCWDSVQLVATELLLLVGSRCSD